MSKMITINKYYNISKSTTKEQLRAAKAKEKRLKLLSIRSENVKFAKRINLCKFTMVMIITLSIIAIIIGDISKTLQESSILYTITNAFTTPIISLRITYLRPILGSELNITSIHLLALVFALILLISIRHIRKLEDKMLRLAEVQDKVSNDLL